MLNAELKHRPERVVATPKARGKVSPKDMAAALQRHWRSLGGGSVTAGRPPDQRRSLAGCRLLTAWRARNGIRFWIISEPDQALTRVLLPEDYA
jgi:hypothetical protein